MQYSFLAEFDVLRFAQPGVQDEKWVTPACREAAVKHFKLSRAREEIIRLNVEVERLQSSIDDEITHTVQVLEELSTRNPNLGVELKRRWRLRSLIDNIHLVKLTKLRDQAYFTGRRQADMGARTGDSEEGIDETNIETTELLGEKEFDIMTDFVEAITD